MSELETLETDLKSLEANISEIETLMNPLLSYKSIEFFREKTSLLDQAKLNASLAYSLNSFYFGKNFHFFNENSSFFNKIISLYET